MNENELRLKTRDRYRKGLKTIWPQSQRSVLAASPNRELCLSIVMPDMSPTVASVGETLSERKN
jgi:hypothetical protein